MTLATKEVTERERIRNELKGRKKKTHNNSRDKETHLPLSGYGEDSTYCDNDDSKSPKEKKTITLSDDNKHKVLRCLGERRSTTWRKC